MTYKIEEHTEFWMGRATPITRTPVPPEAYHRVPDTGPDTPVINLEAIKHDDGKADWSLVPFESLEGMVKVLEFGANKYAGWNWTTNGGFSYTRVLRSCLRHIFAYMRGEDNDPESGLSHIHHAMCNLLFISHYIGNKEKYNKDDRQVR